MWQRTQNNRDLQFLLLNGLNGGTVRIVICDRFRKVIVSRFLALSQMSSDSVHP